MNDTKNCLQTDWMGSLSDTLFINQLSIPGTHDSGARYGIFAKCQNTTIQEQLEMGIRFFDIRLCHISNQLAIYHGPFFQRLYFADVLKTAQLFLIRHPSEVILFRITENEHKPKNNQQTFQETWNTCIQSVDSLIYKGQTEAIQLQDVKGKILLFGQHHSSLPFIYGENMLIQDNYHITLGKTQPISTKLANILSHLTLSIPDSSRVWKVNYCSGTGVPLFSPKKVANRVNPFVLQTLNDSKVHWSGIVLFDFPSQPLIDAVFLLNSQKKQKAE